MCIVKVKISCIILTFTSQNILSLHDIWHWEVSKTSLSLKSVIAPLKTHSILFCYRRSNNKFNEITCKGHIQINPGTLENNLECYDENHHG